MPTVRVETDAGGPRGAFAVWLTGLPSSGKSTIAGYLCRHLRERGVPLDVLESDALRGLLTPAPTYEEAERDLFYRVLAVLGSRLVAHGISVVIDATATKRRYRDAARELIPRFLEVAVECPLEVCIQRDAKGIYRRGLAGELTHVPGLHEAYEPPLAPEIVVQGDATPPESAASSIVHLLAARGWLPERNSNRD